MISVQSTQWDKRAANSIQQQWIVQHSNANAITLRVQSWDSEVLNIERRSELHLRSMLTGRHKLPTDNNTIKIRNCVVDNDTLVMRCCSKPVLRSGAALCNWHMKHSSTKCTVLLARRFVTLKIMLNSGLFYRMLCKRAYQIRKCTE